MKTPKTPIQAERKLNTPKSGGITKRKSNGVGDIKPFPGLTKALKEAAQESKQSPFKKPTPMKGSPKVTNGKPATPKVNNGKPATPKAEKQSPVKPESGKKTPKRKFGEVSFSAKTPETKGVPHVATPFPKSITKQENGEVKEKKPVIKKSKKLSKEEFESIQKETTKEIKKKNKLAKSLARRKKFKERAKALGEPVPKDQLLKKPIANKAVQALRKLVEKESEKGKSILPKEDKQLLVQINVLKPCPVGERCMRFHLSHPIVREGASICLLTTDHKEKEDHFKKLLKEAGVTNIKDVVTYSTLKNEYKMFEQKRKLIMLHDLFLVEGKISHRITPFLGKFSLSSHKIPTPVMLKKDLKKAIDSALEKTSVSIKNTSTSFCCQIGMLGQSDGVISDNIVALSEAINSSLPGGWKNVSSLHLRCDQSSVPIFVSLTSPNDVTIPEPKQKPKKKGQEVVEDELSTIPGARVKVHPDGKVDLKIVKEEADSDEDDEDFEYEEGDSDEDSDDELEEEEEDVGSAEDDLSDGDEDDEETPTKKVKLEVKAEEDSEDEDEEKLGKLESSYLKGMNEKPGKKGKFNKGAQQGKPSPKPQQGKNQKGSFKQNQKQKGKNQKGSPNKQHVFTQKGSPKQNSPKKGGFFKGGKKGGKK